MESIWNQTKDVLWINEFKANSFLFYWDSLDQSMSFENLTAFTDLIDWLMDDELIKCSSLQIDSQFKFFAKI